MYFLPCYSIPCTVGRMLTTSVSLGPLPSCRSYKSDDIKTAATGADLVIVCLGTGNSIEAEGNDRADIELPGQQFQLLKDAVSFSSQCGCGCIYRCMPVSVFWDGVHVCLSV